jgi:acyl-CoA synthetase (AMP-forming)/AMP-acid ligase II
VIASVNPPVRSVPEMLMTIPGLLRDNAHQHGDKAVIVTDDRSITHAELDDESRTMAARLVALGVSKGARVGLLAPNGVEWAVTALAVMRVGGVLVPLSTLLRPPELEAQLDQASVTHLVVARSFRGRSYLNDIEAAVPGLISTLAVGVREPRLPALSRLLLIDDMPTGAVTPELVDALAQRVTPADDMAIVFTSGSRGTPKGTVHTHAGGLGAVASSLPLRRVGPDDRLYIPMPFFWTGGFCSGLLSTLVAGATLLTEAVPEAGRTLELLERERATLFRGWPDQAARLAADPRFAGADLSSLGPASLPAVLPADQRPAPGARANLFGMTETFGPYCGARLDRDLPEAEWGSCGRPVDGVEIHIVDPESEAEVALGDVGEIRVRGRNVMRAIVGRTREETFDSAGFYPTGDLGRIDSAGFLWYHGRRDDMFKVSGATVYPSEVEEALRAVPGVRQAHVTNLAEPQESGIVGALVVGDLGLNELVAGARARLSAFKMPTHWLVAKTADEVPMTATSKVDIVRLRARLQAVCREHDRQASSDAGGGA